MLVATSIPVFWRLLESLSSLEEFAMGYFRIAQYSIVAFLHQTTPSLPHLLPSTLSSLHTPTPHTSPLPHLHPPHSEVTSSQPVTAHPRSGSGDTVDGGVVIESFTQLSRYDELIIGTQVPCTHGASQVRNVNSVHRG